MPRRIKEATIVGQIQRYLNETYGEAGYVRKTHGGNYSRDWPDLVGSVKGVPVVLEVKTIDGQPTPLQLRELDKWRAAGAIAGIVRSVDEVKSLLANV